MVVAQPLLLGTTDDVIILPLPQGSQQKLFTAAVDNVGNRQAMPDIAATDSGNVITIDIPAIELQCPSNCSQRGTCAAFGVCLCQSGYFGNDCGLGKSLT